jgi:hypothetical protein
LSSISAAAQTQDGSRQNLARALCRFQFCSEEGEPFDLDIRRRKILINNDLSELSARDGYLFPWHGSVLQKLALVMTLFLGQYILYVRNNDGAGGGDW